MVPNAQMQCKQYKIQRLTPSKMLPSISMYSVDIFLITAMILSHVKTANLVRVLGLNTSIPDLHVCMYV